MVRCGERKENGIKGKMEETSMGRHSQAESKHASARDEGRWAGPRPRGWVHIDLLSEVTWREAAVMGTGTRQEMGSAITQEPKDGPRGCGAMGRGSRMETLAKALGGLQGGAGGSSWGSS